MIDAGAVAATATVTDMAIGAPTRPSAARVFEVIGPTGIGKSALLEQARHQLVDRSFRVIAHATTAPERSLPWSTLAALLEQFDPAAHGALSAPARQHLAAVLAPTPVTEPRPHGIAAATRELIALASTTAPLALVVDDAQWVDAPSAGVLAFVARALDQHRVLLIVARRRGDPATIEPSSATASSWNRIELGGLSVDAVGELVRVTTGARLPRPLLLDLHERSDGHPQFVIEMARELAAGVDRQHALRRRVASDAPIAILTALPEPTIRVLEFAVLSPRPTLRSLMAISDQPDVLAALEPAETAGLVQLVPSADDLLVRFDPPAVATAIEQRMSTASRRAAHLRLTELAADPIQRAVHLAAAAPAPAAAVADDLESGTTLALRRGDPRTAIRLAEAAVAASPPDDHERSRRRMLALAWAQAHGGVVPDVLATLDRIVVEPRSDEAAQVAVLRIPALAEEAGLDVAAEVAVDVLTWIDGPLRAVVFRHLAAIDRMRDLRLGAETAARSLDAALADGSPTWIATARLADSAARAGIGEAVDIDHAIEIARAEPAGGAAVNELLHLLWYTGDHRGIEWTERTIDAAMASGEAVYELNAQLFQAYLLVPRGDWQRAEQTVWQVLRHGYADASERALLGFLLAATGRAEQAIGVWDGIVSAELTRGRTNVALVHAWRAMGAWALGTADAADQLLHADGLASAVGLRAPRVVPWRRDLVEALTTAGRYDEAQAAAQRMRDDADRSHLALAGADADAAEALLAGEAGDDDRAAELIARAVKVYDHAGERYELARSLLTSGRLARRAGRRLHARRDLEAAAALFTDFGALPWVSRCTAELQRIGGRPRRSATLTDTERLIAEQAAAGKSNAEIAAAMFVAVRTVESNLSRAYRKLGIRSRVQLPARLAESASP